jgi:hypothetical protein
MYYSKALKESKSRLSGGVHLMLRVTSYGCLVKGEGGRVYGKEMQMENVKWKIQNEKCKGEPLEVRGLRLKGKKCCGYQEA